MISCLQIKLGLVKGGFEGGGLRALSGSKLAMSQKYHDVMAFDCVSIEHNGMCKRIDTRFILFEVQFS